jgi:hypothetical protein
MRTIRTKSRISPILSEGFKERIEKAFVSTACAWRPAATGDYIDWAVMMFSAVVCWPSVVVR